MAATEKSSRPKEVFHDEAPPNTDDHPFEPRLEWWTLCKHCGLAESAHKETSLLPIDYMGDYMTDDE